MYCTMKYSKWNNGLLLPWWSHQTMKLTFFVLQYYLSRLAADCLFSFYFILLFFRVLPYCAIVLPFWLIAISAKARKTARMPNSFYCITWKLKSIGGTCRIMKKISKDRVKEISVWNIHNCILWWCYMRFKFENFDVQVTHLHSKLREDFAITLYPALSA